MTVELFDLDTQYQLRKAAPVVAAVPRDVAELVVVILSQWAEKQLPHQDVAKNPYWEASLAELVESSALAITNQLLGRVLRALMLTLWREKDGFHVAWSGAQLQILKRNFETK